MCAVLCYVSLFNHVQLLVTLWIVACQAPLSMWILQARILEWLAIPFLRGSCQPRDLAHISYVSCIDSQVFFFFYISATWVVYRFTYLWKEEAHSLIPMWPFIRMIFCYSLRVVTRLGCQFSCLATARFWIIACLHHWGARAQQVESAGQCTSRRKCCEEILMMLFSVWWRVWGHCQWILRQGVCTHCY